MPLGLSVSVPFVGPLTKIAVNGSPLGSLSFASTLPSPLTFMSSRPTPPGVPVKNSVPFTLVRPCGASPAPTGTVPASVPSLFQRSLPVPPALKKAVPLTSVINGLPLAAPGSARPPGASWRVPAAVPSLTQSVWPMTESNTLKNSFPPT